MRSIFLALATLVVGGLALFVGLALLQWLDQLTSLRFPLSAANHTYLEVEDVPHFHDQTHSLDIWYLEQGLLAKKRRQLVYRGVYTGASTSHPTQTVDITQVAVRYGTQQRVLVTLAGQPIYEFRPALLAQAVQAGNL